MKIFLLSFLGGFFGIITVFIALNFFKKFRNLIFSDKALDDKVFKNHKYHKFKITTETKIKIYKIELDELTAEEKEEIVRDIMLNENFEYDVDNEMPYFIKLVNKYIDRINKIKNSWLN